MAALSLSEFYSPSINPDLPLRNGEFNSTRASLP